MYTRIEQQKPTLKIEKKKKNDSRDRRRIKKSSLDGVLFFVENFTSFIMLFSILIVKCIRKVFLFFLFLHKLVLVSLFYFKKKLNKKGLTNQPCTLLACFFFSLNGKETKKNESRWKGDKSITTFFFHFTTVPAACFFSCCHLPKFFFLFLSLSQMPKLKIILKKKC